MSLFQDHRFSAFFTRLFPFDDSCTVRAHYDFANVTFHLVSRRQYCQLSVLLTLTLATNLQTQCIFKTIHSFHHTLQGCKIDQNNKLDFANIQRTFFFSPILSSLASIFLWPLLHFAECFRFGLNCQPEQDRVGLSQSLN